MNHPETTKQKILIWGILLLASLIVHFFCNLFSPILQPYFEQDQMMFYMAGKAWMSGMMPYVDFIDVKGPLLFLLYGIGYLISPDKTWGTYLLCSIFTTITLIYIYKIGQQLNLTKTQSILACVISLFAFINCDPGSNGGRAEEFLQPFIAATLYFYTTYVQSTNYPPQQHNPSIRRLALTAGLCFAAALLIKYNNITLPIATSALVLWREWRTKTLILYIKHYLPFFIIGALILLTPFFLYFIQKNTLDECIKFYLFANIDSGQNIFFNNLSTAIIGIIVKTIAFTLQDTRGIFLLTGIAFLIPNLFPTKNDFQERISLLILFLAIYLPNCLFRNYYLVVCAPFFAFMAITIAKRLPIHSYKILSIIIFCIIATTITFYGKWARSCPWRLTQKTDSNILLIENELRSIKTPKVLYYNSLDHGFGITCGAMPGSPFWTKLNGLYDLSETYQRKSIIEQIPDYIVYADQGTKIIPDSVSQFFTDNNYHLQLYYRFHNQGGWHISLFKKK